MSARVDPSQYYGDAPKSEALPVVYFEDVKAQINTADFVEDLLTDGAMSITYGQSNSGKTFLIMDLALHVAAGMSWMGRQVEHGGVLWLAMEGSYGVQNRVAAWCKHHGIDGIIPFAIIPIALDLLNPDADTERLIQTIGTVAAKFEIPVRLVVVDTLSRAIAGGNENAPDDMGALVTNGTRIQQTTKCHLAWIHHSGKDEAKGARGHSLLRAATDTEIEISADGPQRLARVTKQREMECTGDIGFQLEVVVLDTNKRGKPVSSCVVAGSGVGHTEDRHHGAPNVLTPKLKGHPRRALEVLHDLLAESGKGGFGVPDGCLSVPEQWWRQRFYDRTVSDGKDGLTESGKRMAFNRAAADLTDRRLVAVLKGRVWSVRAARYGEKGG